MIEHIKQETLNTLTETFLTGLEEGRPRPLIQDARVSKKYALQLLRNYQVTIKDQLPEAFEDSKTAYEEVSQMSHQEFEVLYQELLTIKV